ncbi:MAG: methionine ABC transporter ATP-binding protein [Gammaproteobacteria bacterium]
MIELRDLEKTYQHQQQTITALNHINLNIPAGEIFGVIGQSGAGKSTLIRCINLLETPTQGKVFVDQQDLTQLSMPELRKVRRRIGMIFQHFNLLNTRTVYQNVAFPLELSGKSRQDIQKIVSPLLELTGLTERSAHYPAQLSGGQKQRVAIARALANQPKVLLSDEATSALDPETRHTILQLLKQVNEQLGITIVLITHDIQVIKEICHRLAILEHGNIIEQASVLEFFSRPQTTAAKKFIRNTSVHDLPESLQQRLAPEATPNNRPVWRLSFCENAAREPLISQLARAYQLNLNILQANIEYIRDQMVGVMLVEVFGELAQLEAGKAYLAAHSVFVEVIGYLDD